MRSSLRQAARRVVAPFAGSRPNLLVAFLLASALFAGIVSVGHAESVSRRLSLRGLRAMVSRALSRPPASPPTEDPPTADTVPIFGPRQFAGVAGTKTNYFESVQLYGGMQTGQTYRLRVENIAGAGTLRLDSAEVKVNGTTIFAPSAFASRPTVLSTTVTLNQDYQGYGTDNQLAVVTQSGSNRYLRITILPEAVPLYVVYSHELTAAPGNSISFSDNFTVPSNAGPYRVLQISPGTETYGATGFSGNTNPSISVNGTTVITGYNTLQRLVKPVTLSAGSNSLSVTTSGATCQNYGPSGYCRFTIRFAVSDTAKPTLAVSQPSGSGTTYTSASSYSVSGTVSDQTITTVTAKVGTASPTSMTVNSDGTWSGSISLPSDGVYSVLFTATDAAGNQSTVTKSIGRDGQAPSLTVTNPTEGLNTSQSSITVTGTASDNLSLVTVNVNGTSVTTSGGPYSVSTSLSTEGLNIVTVTATDEAGNSVSIVRQVTRDTQAPSLTVMAPANGTSTDLTSVTVSGTVSDANSVSVAINGNPATVTSGSFSSSASLSLGSNTISVVATDAAGNTTTVSRSVTRTENATPYDVMPIDRTIASSVMKTGSTTSLANAAAFLYSGSGAVQTGLASGKIVPTSVSVLHGRVKTRDGAPLSGVTVKVLGDTTYGSTTTRSNGIYDMVVNGGDPLMLSFTKSGYLPIQRRFIPDHQGYAIDDEAVMIAQDTAVTSINFSTAAQTARATASSDSRGIRRPTLIFKSGTVAKLRFANGDSSTLDSIHVRATEYTVGTTGPAAMPGPLPSTSAYTYALDMSADEAITAGASHVTFSKPISVYLENFLSFPVGEAVPVGSYDESKGVWLAEANGRIIKIVGVTDSLANIAIDSTLTAASSARLDTLGIDTAERVKLASLYSTGTILWRVPVTHFTSGDWNWPFQLAVDAIKHVIGSARHHLNIVCTQCHNPGSDIGVEAQTLGEEIGLPGVPFTLRYQSQRTIGYGPNYSITRSVIGDSVPPSLKAIVMELDVAGRKLRGKISATDSTPIPKNATLTIPWDGLDGFGRRLQGRTPVSGRVGYTYLARYFGAGSSVPASEVNHAFGVTSAAQSISTGYDSTVCAAPCSPRPIITTWMNVKDTIGGWDARVANNLGGWSLSAHHAYDPIGRVLYRGDGSQRAAEALGYSIKTIVGNGTGGFSGDSGQATSALIRGGDIAYGPNGALYVADAANHRIRKISRNGIITTVVGNGNRYGPYGWATGDSALKTAIGYPSNLAIAPDGTVYFTSESSDGVDYVSPKDGRVHQYGGRGTWVEGEIVNDTTEMRGTTSLAVGPDGVLYIANPYSKTIRKITPDGRGFTVAGHWTAGSGCDFITAPVPALSVALCAGRIALGTDGSVYHMSYIGDHRQLLRVDPTGIITPVAGTSSNLEGGDGGPAASASFDNAQGIAVGQHNEIYITSQNGWRVRRIEKGIITTFAGTGSGGWNGDDKVPAASQVDVGANNGIAIDPEGNLVLSEQNRIRKVGPALPGYTNDLLVVAENDGSVEYVFDAEGKHLRTISGTTGKVLLRFTYDADGRLTKISDADSNHTTIERNGSTGDPTAIVGPFGHRTTLTLNADKYLATVVDALADTVRLHYTAYGLLDTLRTPKGGIHRYTYDAEGRLTSDIEADTSSRSLSVTQADSGNVATLTSYLGRSTRNTLFFFDGKGGKGTSRTQRDAAGLVTTSEQKLDGTTRVVSPDGTIVSSRQAADPRFGLGAPFSNLDTLKLPSGLTMVTRTARAASVTDASNATSVVSTTDSLIVNGKAFVSTYTGSTRSIATRTPTGRVDTTVVDSVGRVLESRTPGLPTVSYTYDSKGRLATVSAAGRTTTYGYGTSGGANGQLVRLINAKGDTTKFEYDTLARLTATVLADGRRISYEYDQHGNVRSIVPPGRDAHTFTFTATDAEASYTAPAPDTASVALVTRTKYDRDGAVTDIIRASGQADSSVIHFSYDTAGRPITMALPGTEGSVGFTYSATTGLLTKIAAPGNDTLTFTYDGSLPTAQAWSGPVAGSVQVTYDSDLRPSTVKVNGATSIAIGYDNDGLLTSTGALTLTRDAALGRLTGDTIGNMGGTVSYDSIGQLSGLTERYGGSAIYSTSYTRDVLGRITGLIETVGSVTHSYGYAYDTTGRLKTVTTDGSTSASYTYDSNGNRLSRTTSGGTEYGSYDAQDRMTSYGTATYKYKKTGELSQKIVGTDTTKYTYDARGNLIKVALPNGDSVTYVIDGQNRRIGRKVNGVLTQAWLWQGQLAPAAELDGSGNVVSRFVYATHVNVPDYMIKLGVTYRIVTDHLGSVRLVVNVATGSVAQRIDYDEFGRITSDSNQAFQPFGFAGGLLDSATGLVRFGARDYQPDVGRWSAKDLSRFAGGQNLYNYAQGDPQNEVDLDGDIPVVVAYIAGQAIRGAAWGAALDLALQLATNDCIDWSRVGHAALIGGATGGLLAATRLLTALRTAERVGESLSAAFDDARAAHIFREAEGHVNPTTAASRARFAKLFERVASNPANLRTDAVSTGLVTQQAEANGVRAFTWTARRGQVWVLVRNGIIQNAGINRLGAIR